MNILSDKIVKVRKKRMCDACGRKFEPGTKMKRQVNDYDGLLTFYECHTCQILLSKHRDYFDDGCGICESYCVRDSLERNQTPEELLSNLDKSKL